MSTGNGPVPRTSHSELRSSGPVPRTSHSELRSSGPVPRTSHSELRSSGPVLNPTGVRTSQSELRSSGPVLNPTGVRTSQSELRSSGSSVSFTSQSIMPSHIRISFQKALARNHSESDILSFCATSNKIRKMFEICQTNFWIDLLNEDLKEYKNYLKIVNLFYPAPNGYRETVQRYYKLVGLFREANEFITKWQAGNLEIPQIQEFLSVEDWDLFGNPASLILFLVLKKNIFDFPNREGLLEFYSSLIMGTPRGFIHQANAHFLTLFALLASRNNDEEFLEQVLNLAELEGRETFEAIPEILNFFSGFSQREKRNVLLMIEALRELWEM